MKLRTGWQWPEGRGEGITREKGEGFTGTTTKDTWTITRGVETGEGGGDGWGGGEEWKEKAENCTWTTIKIVLKKRKSKKEDAPIPIA